VKKLHSLIAILFSFVVTNVALALPAPTFRTVALLGQHAPGLPNDTFFSSFGVPSVNNLGQVSFSGSLSGPPRDILTTNNTGIWTEGMGALALLAREGDAAAGATAGQVYNDLLGILTNIADSGDVAWLSSMRPPVASVFPTAIWSGNVGTVQMHASAGGGAPGLPAGVTISSIIDTPVINSQGDVAYRATINGPGVLVNNDLTVWSTAGGTAQLLVRENDPAPGTSAEFMNLWSVRINDAGQVAVSADVRIVESGGTNPESGWWLSNGSTLNLLVKDFSPAPGVPGAEFNVGQSAPISLNSSGRVAFGALMRLSVPAGVDTTNDLGIWSSGSGSLQLVAREGSQAPGVVAGAKFSSFSSPKLGDGGHTAFSAILANDAALGISFSNNTGIWSDANGSLELVARAGDQAPGMPMGAVFNGFINPRSSVEFALNSAGHVAFINNVVGGGTTVTGTRGLWAQDQNGNLRLVLRQGEMFEVAPGDVRLITGIDFHSQSAGGDGLSRGFNDNYQLGLRIFFSNNTSGVFVTSITVPEPAGLALILSAFSMLFARCKQRG
jgi:hypothetical protein